MNALWNIYNPSGKKRIIVTRNLPGEEWKKVFAEADCCVEIYCGSDTLPAGELFAAIGNRCDGILGQLFDQCSDALFDALAKSGGKVYSNYAVGFNNIDMAAATLHGIAIGNTPGVPYGNYRRAGSFTDICRSTENCRRRLIHA